VVERRPTVVRTGTRRAVPTASGPASASTLDFPEDQGTK
jgi:hypothetical protein